MTTTVLYVMLPNPFPFSSSHNNQSTTHTKALAENLVLKANRVGGMLTVAIRPTTIYGEGDLLITANLCRNACMGRARNQLGDGKNLVDVTYVKNVAYEVRAISSGTSSNQGVVRILSPT